MVYAIPGDVFTRFEPIKTMVGVNTFEVTSIEVASVFIADAESFMDSYLGVRYVTPIAPVVPLITQLASDLAIFNMMAEKVYDVPDPIQARYDRSVKMLEMLRDGMTTLPGSIEIKAAGDQEAWSTTEDYHPVFSGVLDDLNQAPDHDRVEADRDARADDPGVDTDDC